MKNIKYIITIILFGSLALSCSLEEKSYTEIDMDEYIKNAAEANNVLMGIYGDLCDEGMYRYNLGMLLDIPTDLAKGEGSTTNAFRIVPANAYTSVQSDIELTWEALYKAVYDANSFIRLLALNVENFDDDDKALATVYMGEARALRALCYFELVRWFGNITLTTDPMYAYKNTLSEMEQDDPVKVYEQIEKDLLYAAEVLPYATDDNLRTSNDFRFSKGAALGLLAKVYATWAGYPVQDESKWEKAAETAKILIDSGKHALLTEGVDGDSGYEQLWWNTCNGVWDPTESLIEISFYSPTSTASGARLGRIGKWNGVLASNIKGIRNIAYYRVLPSFIKKWPNLTSDLRAQLSVANYRYLDETRTKYDLQSSADNKIAFDPNQFATAFTEGADSKLRDRYSKNLTPAKWDTEKYVKDANYMVDQNLSNVNWYVLRYADVLLLYAEALNEMDGTYTDPESGETITRDPAEICKAFNQIRYRAGLPGITEAEANNREAMRDLIKRERQIEFACEHMRFFDLRRWGDAMEMLNKPIMGMNVEAKSNERQLFYTPTIVNYKYARRSFSFKMNFFPIHRNTLDKNPKLVQNPGW